MKTTRTTVISLLAALSALAMSATALAPRAEAHVYWSAGAYGTDIGRANLDGSGLKESFITRGSHSVGIVRVDAGHIYWSEYWGEYYDPHSAIGRARLDGTHIDKSFIPSAGFAALDANHFYSPANRWSIADTFIGASIGRRTIDGSGAWEELITGIEGPVSGIAVDANHLYWAQEPAPPVTPDSSEIGAIGRANLDGTEVEREFITFPAGAASPRAIAVDASQIYWATGYGPDFSPPTIGRANLDGTGVDQSFITGETLNFRPTDLALDADHIYWANPSEVKTGSIGRANLDGTDVDERFIAPPVPASPESVAVDARTDTMIRAKAAGKPTQKQGGKRIRVAVKVKAKERLTVKATGKITVNPTYRLKPKRVELDAGETRTLKLKPKKRVQVKKIARALKRGEKAKAKLTVKLTDAAANSETEKLRVRLKR